MKTATEPYMTPAMIARSSANVSCDGCIGTRPGDHGYVLNCIHPTLTHNVINLKNIIVVDLNHRLNRAAILWSAGDLSPLCAKRLVAARAYVRCHVCPCVTER